MPKELKDDPLWYKKAVFYEVFPRGFYDSNNDGFGDLKGVTEKLEFLSWLGIDCIWLLPFYASPMKDGGYDISDFENVDPSYGTFEDLIELIDKAHSMGIRVISDLVVNHSSDQHPWFLESRSSRDNPKADWYVWSDDDSLYSNARIIFTDVENSNWAWDQVRQQYYWHRFYSHQPDLNYDNPEVQEVMLNVVKRWLDLGLDGFRLDAVSYLFQRNNTNCENLPETHEFLKLLRKEIDSRYPNRVLLAEVNQWPTDLVDYFGEDDECHMCFQFPLMPRMFMAVRREQRLPITEILSLTPNIPENCQWGLFLRNHDELTLEQVSDEERDYMFSEYAKDNRMKRHMGIARRFAPLVDNSRSIAELLHSMLFSLPGSPILYYGDEIMMGDNTYLKDRDSVRTPMQWTPDRNGGFSLANFEQLYLPPLMDPVYGYQSVNVESQFKNPGSFLQWIKKLITVRSNYQVFGSGKFEILHDDNPSIFAFLRYFEEQIGASELIEENTVVEVDNIEIIDQTSVNKVLCIYNLSRFAQPAELDLSKYKGSKLVELSGRVLFPQITESPYRFTLGPHGYYWFEITDQI